MVRRRWVFAGLLLLAPTHALACKPGPAWIRLEVTAPEASALGGRWVEIDRAGCLHVGFPAHDLRRGEWQRTIPADTLGLLELAVAALPTDQRQLDWEIERGRQMRADQAVRALVVDAEHRVLRWEDAGRTHKLSAVGLASLVSAFPEGDGLKDTLDAVRSIDELLDPTQLSRVVTP